MDVCPYCGEMHDTMCPRIKAIEYFPNGIVKHVELRKPEPPPDPMRWPGLLDTKDRPDATP